MSTDARLAGELMDRFAELTGLTGDAPPRRYLWTDAFAVCNYLGLHADGGEERWLKLAHHLVDQVHQVLGRHRADDPREGWISGRQEQDGELHPTAGGLRIGKELPERDRDEPLDPRREWDRDGQYFHYLTQWMHALRRMSDVTGEAVYHRWGRELAQAAHRAFTVPGDAGEPSRMVWKMSVDLQRPLVPSMGQHDPLSGLVAYLELRASAPADAGAPALSPEIVEATALCWGTEWSTGDPLGIGGLLVEAARLARLVVHEETERDDLLRQVVADAVDSLATYRRSDPLELPPERRLAFRELGLSIGLQAVERAAPWMADAGVPDARLSALEEHGDLAARIEKFWATPEHRQVTTWSEHREINMVMLATSLQPGGYLGF